MQRKIFSILGSTILFLRAHSSWVDPKALDRCPGYNAVEVHTNGTTLTASLVLSGQPCNVFGEDVRELLLTVVYETKTRIHLRISDPSSRRYEVPELVFPRPHVNHPAHSQSSEIQFNYTATPFSFSIHRASTSEVLFSTTTHPIIFEPQYLRLKTNLPQNANIYGLGEHTDPFRLPTHNTTRTMWSRNANNVPPGTNLYGNHPVYFEHRTSGTHGVFLLNSNGMDIKINDTEGSGTTLEYNVIGGILDLYFLAGSETDPTEVARQYAQVVGTPAEVPYWSFGLHQCRFGYTDFVNVAEVISNYSAAGIALETMWTDIDYMLERRVFTVDPDYFPLPKMREIVAHLHSNDQKYVLMTDPAVAYLPGQGYGPYDRGTRPDIWLKAANGSDGLGLVWPGVTVFPDWFNSKVHDYWSNEFAIFYSPLHGLDIDGVWIDMNEPTSFCVLPCTDIFQQAIEQVLPPPRTTLPPDPNTPIFVNSTAPALGREIVFPICEADTLATVSDVEDTNAPADFCTMPPVQLFPELVERIPPPDSTAVDVLDSAAFPVYEIDNAAGDLSSGTAPITSKHANGLTEYDTHNLYGDMMSMATRAAMLDRRPGLRPLVITRSTFAGAGKHVGKWLGDNLSLWEHYRFSIAGMLGMASVYQVPMVGSDICGFSGNTTETLCARWAMLGAFYPFMRNHNAIESNSQEFYLWESVTQAAKNALDIRYRLIDYIYTAFHQAHTDGTPVINPLWFKYPKDPATFSIDLQFLYGDSLLVSPVTDENATSVSIYLPKDIFYDFQTLSPVQGHGASILLSNISFTSIPLHIRGGAIIPLRNKMAMTTTAIRRNDFEFVIAPGMDGKASGQLYVDDGISITPASSTMITMEYQNKRLDIQGSFAFPTGVNVARVRFLGISRAPHEVLVNGKELGSKNLAYDRSTQVLDVIVGLPFDAGLIVEFS